MRAPKARAASRVRIVADPRVSASELHAFYARTGVCEAGFSPEYAGRVLTRSDVILAAYHGKVLVGFARGLCDGTTGYVAELCVDPAFQGPRLRHANASVIERDDRGLGLRLGTELLQRLRRLGAVFFSAYAVEGVEERFYRSLGFVENTGHTMFVIDDRDYVAKSRGRGAKARPGPGRRS